MPRPRVTRRPTAKAIDAAIDSQIDNTLLQPLAPTKRKTTAITTNNVERTDNIETTTTAKKSSGHAKKQSNRIQLTLHSTTLCCLCRYCQHSARQQSQSTNRSTTVD